MYTGGQTTKRRPPKTTNFLQMAHSKSTQAGASPEDTYKNLYDTAKARNMSVEDVSSEMGYAPDKINQYISQMGWDPLSTKAPSKSPSVVNKPVSGGGALSEAAGVSTNPVVDNSFKSYADGLRQQGLEGLDLYGRMYGEAARRGMTSDQVDTELGYDPGTSGAFINKYGWNPLGGGSSEDPLTMPSLERPSALQYRPVTRQMTGAETVEDRLARIIEGGRGGALQDAAITAASQAMGRRGFANSDIADSAVLDAIIKNAMPIASQDARTATEIANQNQGYTNRAGEFNASLGTQVGMANADANNQLLTNDYGTRLGAQLDIERMEKQWGLNQQVMETEHGYKLLLMRMQEKLDASGELTKQQAGLVAQFTAAAGEIASSDIKAAQKGEQIQALWDRMIEGSNLVTETYTSHFALIDKDGNVTNLGEDQSLIDDLLARVNAAEDRADDAEDAAASAVDGSVQIDPKPDGNVEPYIKPDGNIGWKKVEEFYT